MTEKTEHELRCEMLFEQHKENMARIEQDFKDYKKKADINCNNHAGKINTIRATLNERERAAESKKDTAIKMIPWVMTIIFGMLASLAWSRVESNEGKIAAHATEFTTWVGSHETQIEHRDTVQCLNIQALQVAYNNGNDMTPVQVIDCGDGAGQ